MVFARRPQPGRHVLIWLTLSLVPAFVVTAFVSHAFREKHHALAIEWAQRGNDALEQSRPTDAVAAYRTALTFDRESRPLRLRIATALVADGRPAEATAYLRTLWDAQPGNGPVNLELARLSARSGDVASAVRYYHNAAEGAWADGAEARRRAARMELAQLLVERRAFDDAQAELIHLAGDLPPEPEAQVRIADLFVQAQLPRRALAIYRDVLRGDPGHAAAAGGAGLTAFALGDDVAAERYLVMALRETPDADRLADTLAVVRALRAADPFQRRLSARTRAARAARAIDRAVERLKGCPAERKDAAALVTQLIAARPMVTAPQLADEPERLDMAMELVFTAERLAEDACGAATPLDRALLTIGQRRSVTE
jgi:predicted Zn-dependent protease